MQAPVPITPMTARPAVPRSKMTLVVGGGLVLALSAGVAYYLYTKKASVATAPVVSTSGQPVGSTGSTVAALSPVTLSAAPTYNDATSTSVTHVQAYTTHDEQSVTGTDLTNAQQPDLPSCQTYCSAVTGCVGGVYGKVNQACKLKSSYDASTFVAAPDTATFVKS